MTTSHPKIPLRQVLRNPILFVAFGFASGCARKAPGTFGTLAAVPFYILAQALCSAAVYALLTLVMFLVGIWICERACQILQTHDHPGIVWDEFVGYFITMIAAPPGWYWIIIGFIVFRLFDILKPWPIRSVDRYIEGGFGVMADDVLAGVYAWLTMQVLVVLWTS